MATMHTMATSLLESRPMVGTVLYIGKDNLSPQRRTREKWLPRLPCIPTGLKMCEMQAGGWLPREFGSTRATRARAV